MIIATKQARIPMQAEKSSINSEVWGLDPPSSTKSDARRHPMKRVKMSLKNIF